MSDLSEKPGKQNRAVATIYCIAEAGFDAVAGWILISQGHIWWALAWFIFAGLCANTNAKKHA